MASPGGPRKRGRSVARRRPPRPPLCWKGARRGARSRIVDALAAQLHLGLRLTPTAGPREEFVTADANQAAVARVDRLSAGALALVGPPGVGKSHLARAWAEAAGAVRLELGAEGAWPHAPGPLLVEDADRAASRPGAGEQLFHLLNRAARPGCALLLTARTPPSAWPTALPDLRSRLNALAVEELAEPDEATLAALLQRFFRERGVAPSPELTAYLLRRIERSASAASEVVRRLDDAAHALGRPVGRGLARHVLEDAPD